MARLQILVALAAVVVGMVWVASSIAGAAMKLHHVMTVFCIGGALVAFVTVGSVIGWQSALKPTACGHDE